MFDASDDTKTTLIGAASVTNSVGDGYVQRITMKDGFVYALTFKKGLQVVSSNIAIDNVFRATGGKLSGTPFFVMMRDLNTDGVGFGQDAVVQSIPIRDAQGEPARMSDLKVADYIVDGLGQTLVAAVGELGLVILNPSTGQRLATIKPKRSDGPVPLEMSWGYALALGRVESRDVAVVVGIGTAGSSSESLLAVVDMTQPKAPTTLGMIVIDGPPSDVILNRGTAMVAGGAASQLVSVSDPAMPRKIGAVPNVSGRLASSPAGDVLLSTAGGFQSSPLGGIRTVELKPLVCPPLPAIAAPAPFAVEELGWRMDVVVSEDDGLAVSRVGLGNRQMAHMY